MRHGLCKKSTIEKHRTQAQMMCTPPTFVSVLARVYCTVRDGRSDSPKYPGRKQMLRHRKKHVSECTCEISKRESKDESRRETCTDGQKVWRFSWRLRVGQGIIDNDDDDDLFVSGEAYMYARRWTTTTIHDLFRSTSSSPPRAAHDESASKWYVT